MIPAAAAFVGGVLFGALMTHLMGPNHARTIGDLQRERDAALEQAVIWRQAAEDLGALIKRHVS